MYYLEVICITCISEERYHQFVGKENWFSVLCTCKSWNRIGSNVFDPSLYSRILYDKEGAYPTSSFVWSCANGKLESVKKLLKDKRVDPSAENNSAIRAASENGQLEVVKELLKDKRVDPSADDNSAISAASENRREAECYAPS